LQLTAPNEHLSAVTSFLQAQFSAQPAQI